MTRNTSGLALPHRDEILALRYLSPTKYKGGKYRKVTDMGYRGGDHMNSAPFVAERSGDRRHVTVTLPKLKFMDET